MACFSYMKMYLGVQSTLGDTGSLAYLAKTIVQQQWSFKLEKKYLKERSLIIRGGRTAVKFHKGGPKNINPPSNKGKKILALYTTLAQTIMTLPQNGIGRYSICSNMEVNLNTWTIWNIHGEIPTS